MNISVVCPTRRSTKIQGSIMGLNKLARVKEKVEYLIWVDSDDKVTISNVKELKKKVDNFRSFVCPRVGFNNIWFMIDQLIKVSKGKVIFPWADDCTAKSKKWDLKLCSNMEEEVVVGRRTRFGFTRKFWEKHKIVDIYRNDPQYAAENIRDYARKHNLYIELRRAPYSLNKDNQISREKFKEADIPTDFNILNYEV